MCVGRRNVPSTYLPCLPRNAPCSRSRPGVRDGGPLLTSVCLVCLSLCLSVFASPSGCPQPGGPTPPFVPGVSIPPLAPPTPSAQIPYSGHGPALSHPHQHQPPSSVLGPAMLPHHPHLHQPPSVLTGPVMLPHHPHQQKPPCGPGPYMLPHNHSKQQGYAGPGLTLALEEVLNTGKYIMPGFSAVARGVLEARGLTFESAMAFLVSM